MAAACRSIENRSARARVDAHVARRNHPIDGPSKSLLQQLSEQSAHDAPLHENQTFFAPPAAAFCLRVSTSRFTLAEQPHRPLSSLAHLAVRFSLTSLNSSLR